MLFKRNKPVLPDNTPKVPVGIRVTSWLIFIVELGAARAVEYKYGWLVSLALCTLISLMLAAACYLGKESTKPYSMFIIWRNMTLIVTAIYVARMLYWAFKLIS